MKAAYEIIDSPDRERDVIFLAIDNYHGPLCLKALIFCCKVADCAQLYDMCKKFQSASCTTVKCTIHRQRMMSKQWIGNDTVYVDGQGRILICTNSCSMGINFKAVYHIVTYGPPRSMANFIQHMGRAGREMRKSSCTVI